MTVSATQSDPTGQPRAERGPIALTMGDPAGCGPQITARAWNALRHSQEHASYVIGDPSLYERYCPVEIIQHAMDTFDVWPNTLPVAPLSEPMPTIIPGSPDTSAANAIIESIERAVSDVTTDGPFGRSAAVVTNPISKAGLYEAGFEFPGHTEFLSHLCQGNQSAPLKPVMMLVGGGLRVALATIHIPLMEVGKTLSRRLLEEVAHITHADLQHRFGIDRPRLVFTGLNPHAGESGTIGREEIDIINPAADALRDHGIDIRDARPGDTVFSEMLAGQFDAIIAMTHDQGLIPVKTLDIWGGVNCTLGLPIIRTSPDHGTAYEAAAAGNARPDSLIAAIQLAAKMVDEE